MRRIAVVASDRREFSGVHALRGEGKTLALPVAYARSIIVESKAQQPEEWLLLAGGVGAAAAAKACAAIPQPETLGAILSVGYCGGAREDWCIGDVLLASVVKDQRTGDEFPCTLPSLAESGKRNTADLDETASPATLRQGVVLTVDRIIRFAAEKHQIGQTGVDAIEMEAATVARFAQRMGIPFAAVKSVSDTCHEDLAIDFDRARRPDGSMRIGSILMQILSQGRQGIASAGRLAKASRVASASLGEAIVGKTW